MVVIKKRNNVIPVDFGEFQLEFLANDENIKKIEETGKRLKEKGQELADKEDDGALETLQDLVKGAFDDIFGQGAFWKVYDFSGSSTMDTLAYFLEAVKGVVAEWEERNNPDALKKYLSR